MLDEERCVSCGLCVHVCPTDVFVQRGSSEMKLLDTFQNASSEHPVELTCPRNEQPEQSRVPDATVIQAPRCLAALSTPLLLVLERQVPELWLNDAVCAECPIGRVQPYIERTATATNTLLAAFGRQPSVRTYVVNESELLEAPHEQRVLSGEEPTYSRRGFFTSLGRFTRQAAVAVLSESLATSQDQDPRTVDERLPHHLPSGRRQLLLRIRTLGEPSDHQVDLSQLGVADVLIDGDKCSACGLCARFCPTGALKMVADESHFVLALLLAACIDCGICALICPDDAVSFRYEAAAAVLANTEHRHVLAGTLIPCARCKQPVASQEGETSYCYVCRSPRPQETLFSSLPL